MCVIVSQVNTIQPPKASQLASLQDWLRDFNGGNSFLQQQEAFTWSDTKQSSYVCLNATPKENDVFLYFTSHKLLRVWHALLGQHVGTGKVVDEATGHTSYTISGVKRMGAFIAFVLASTFPVLTILALNRVESTNKRIGMAAAFTALFAIIIVEFTDARRIEIFAATAT